MASPAPAAEPTPDVPAPSLFSLKGENVLITGGSRGIGRAMAVALAEAGASICIAQRDVAKTETADIIHSKGAQAQTIKCDLSNMEDAKSVVQRALDVMGGRIDVVINCGGLLQRKESLLVTEEDWDGVVDVNLKALFLVSREAGKHMIPRRKGKIINVASINSFIGGETVASYAASKGAVSQLTKALSNEWAKYNIQVNAIAPGSVATDINTDLRADAAQYEARIARCPAGRWGDPKDFAGPSLFLASAASQYVSGAILVVDGGHLGK